MLIITKRKKMMYILKVLIFQQTIYNDIDTFERKLMVLSLLMFFEIDDETGGCCNKKNT